MTVWPFRSPPSLVLGTYGPRLFPRRLTVPLAQARTHIHVIGSSGSGKSRFLAGLYLSLLRLGCSATLIDPHGDLSELALASLVAGGVFDDPTAYQRILYLDLPTAEAHGRYMPCNVLARDAAASQGEALPDDAIAANVKEACHRAWPELAQGAATFDTLLPDAVLLLLHHHLPLTAMRLLLVNDAFREQLLATERDPELVSSFRDVYDKLRKPDQVAYAGSVLRRARQLTQVDVLRYGLGQPELLVDFRRILAHNQSVIINLNLQNSDARRLLGCLLTVGAEQAALARGRIPARERTGSHHLIIDEAFTFLSQSGEAFGAILSQARKFGLHLTMGNQSWEQVPGRLRSSLQNVGMRVIFNLDHDDAVIAAPIVGRFEPLAIKHEVTDEAAQERSHPVFESLPEQWQRWAQAIQDLRTGDVHPPGEAFIRIRNRGTTKVTAPWVPDPVVDPGKLAEVRQHYLATCFRSKAELAPAASFVRPQDATHTGRRVPLGDEQ